MCSDSTPRGVLVDPDDPGEAVRALFYLEHTIQDGRTDKAGNRRVVSRQLQFVETDATGSHQERRIRPLPGLSAGDAGRTDHSGATLESQAWLKGDLESVVVGHAIANLVPIHLDEVRKRREDLVTRTMAAVKDRLTKEITYWDHRANQLKDQELAGRTNAKINSGKARQRADELQARLQRRMAGPGTGTPDFAFAARRDRWIAGRSNWACQQAPPVFRSAREVAEAAVSAEARKKMELLAMQMVMEAERKLGNEPRDVSAEKCGYDIESKVEGFGACEK